VSYYIYVTRNPDFLEDPESAPDPISRDEWEAIIAVDETLEIVEPPNKNPNDPGVYAVWNGHPSGDLFWFDLSEGRISVNLHGGAIGEEIDPAVLARMRRFALKLRAQIISELGEKSEPPSQVARWTPLKNPAWPLLESRRACSRHN
jgi:hypothetical protein